MKKYLPLFLLAFTVLCKPIYSQQSYQGYNNTIVSVDFDNNGFVDDVVGFNTTSLNYNLNLWQNTDGSFIENEVAIDLPIDLSDVEFLKGKVVSGDFDNDGYHDDIASIYEIGLNKTSITVWINKDGKYKAKQWWYGGNFDANQTKLTMVSGDFDNDGFIDDIAAFYDYQNDQTKVFVWKSDSEKFGWPGTWWVGNDFSSVRIQGKMVVGDFDHDGFVDDIAALYDYVDNYCKIFVWPSNGNKFAWPGTYYKENDFIASKVKGNVVAGDFNENGFIDNIAAFYMNDEYQSEILVWQRNKTGFDSPETWWYGNSEGYNTNNRLVAFDSDGNGVTDQFSGIGINEQEANINTWTAENKSFSMNSADWQGIALYAGDCEKNGGCLINKFGENIQVYPNPASDLCRIALPGYESDNVEINIYNNLGSLVFKSNATCGKEVELAIDHLNTGNYMIQIQGENVNHREKLVIQ